MILLPPAVSTLDSTLYKSAPPCSHREEEALRELLIISIVLTLVVVAIYVSFS